ncbi:hypothetical protein HGA34_02900 [Candidatus Falkowbacteria bacterium]|nr:hypothetical protein [Candidatus Falkowbacteria bacterium]
MTELFSCDTTRQLVPFPDQVGSLGVAFALYDRAPSIWQDTKLQMPFATNAVHQLLGGTQVLIQVGPIYPGRAPHFDNTGPERYYLAGIDDGPFVTPISSKKFVAFQKDGEAAFYDSLKPAEIKLIESATANPARRQGDIWAIKIGESWDNPGSEIPYAIQAVKSAKMFESTGQWLFESRHSLHGNLNRRVIIVYSSEPKKSKTSRPKFKVKSMAATLGSGLIKAPDHPPLDISDGVYVLARTSRPRNFSPGMD